MDPEEIFEESIERICEMQDQRHYNEETILLDGGYRSRPAPPTARGVSNTVKVRVGLGSYETKAYHKPLDDTSYSDRNARRYGQTEYSRMLNELMAWRLAAFLGPPYSNFVPPAVWRECDGDEGVLILGRYGKKVTRLRLREISDDVIDAAAFWDSLIAQQDRNNRNALWNKEESELFLIDHGYSFAGPNDLYVNEGHFLNKRIKKGREDLTSNEIGILRMMETNFPSELSNVMEAHRLVSLWDRRDEMLETGKLLVRSFIR